MLVLSRHCGESIIIGSDIIITVSSIRGDKVRLAIEAPSKTSVHRKEVYDAILSQGGLVQSLAKDDIDLEEMRDRCSDPQE